MKNWICIALAALFVFGAGQGFAQSKKQQPTPSGDKVYRWVDEEGNVHYTATLPPDFKDKKADVLDKQGITRETDLSLVPPPPETTAQKSSKGELPRDSSGMVRPEPLYNPTEMQKQKDALLVLRYHSEEEINDALQVEIRQLAYDTNLLATTRKSLDNAYAGTIRELADRQRAGVEIPPEEIKNIETMKRKMAANDRNMDEIRLREKTTQEKFAADLERYRYLVEQNSAE
ncbi:MAG TPA: DUF4124 domain-containing protein [Xanthomonadales bacterium]|nr:DUF4124 domain-containing protein [Xanthomonadales bacterium]